MDSIPGELIYIIIMYCNPRVTCLLVCKLWLNAFRTHCNIRPHINKTNHFLGYFKCKNFHNDKKSLRIIFNRVIFNPGVKFPLTPELFVKYIQDPGFLLQVLNKAKYNPSDANILINACKNADPGIVELLLADPRVDPTANNNAAMMKAVIKNRVKIVELLLSQHRVRQADNANSLEFAVCRGLTEIVDLLINTPGVRARRYNYQYLIYIATHNNNLNVVKLLLAKQAKKNPRDNNNFAFYAAVCENNYDIVEMLLDTHRVDLNNIGHDVINVAIEKKYTKIITLLYEWFKKKI